MSYKFDYYFLISKYRADYGSWNEILVFENQKDLLEYIEYEYGQSACYEIAELSIKQLMKWQRCHIPARMCRDEIFEDLIVVNVMNIDVLLNFIGNEKDSNGNLLTSRILNTSSFKEIENVIAVYNDHHNFHFY